MRGKLRQPLTTGSTANYLCFLLVLLLMHLLAWSGLAQTTRGSLQGRVINQEGQPLEGVSLQLIGTSWATRTDAKGTYVLSSLPFGTYAVQVTHLGYQPHQQNVTIAARTPLVREFVLKAGFQQLAEVVIEAKTAQSALTRQIEALRQSALPVTVIDAREFAGRSITMNEILNQQSGMRIRQSGAMGSSSQVSIRGMEGKRVQLYINDNPVYAPEGSLSLHDIPISDYSRIEVYKGFVPAYLGADGLGGAINLVGKENYQQQLDVSLMHGSYNSNQAVGSYRQNFARPGISLRVAGSASWAENNYRMKSPFRPDLTIERDHDRYWNYQGSVNLEFNRLWFDDFQVSLVRYVNQKEIQGIATNVQQALTASSSWAQVLNLKKKDFLVPGLDFRFSLMGSQLRGRFVDTASYRYDFYGNRFASPSGRGETGNYGRDATNRQFDYRSRVNFNYQLTGSSSLNLNVMSRMARLDPNDPVANAQAGRNISHFPGALRSTVVGATCETNWLGNRLQNIAVFKYYAFHSESRTPFLYLSAGGGEPDRVSSSLANIGYGNAIRYKLAPGWSVKASYERAFRVPQPTEIFGNGLLITPAPRLRPERADNGNLTLQFERVSGRGQRLAVEVTAFVSRIRDNIILSGNGLLLGYVNYGLTRLLGAEAEVKADLHPHWLVVANATYSDLRDVAKLFPGTSYENPTRGLRIPNVPYLFANATLEYHRANWFGGQGMNTRLIYEHSFTEGFTYDFQVSRNVAYAIPRNFIHAFSLEQSICEGRITLGAEAYNLTNARVINNFNNPLPGRVFRLKLRYVWKKRPAST